MDLSTPPWPYLPTLARLALALALGLFVGMERERRGKEAGLRTFAFTALLGALGGLLGSAFALVALGLLGVLIVLLNIETLHTGEGAEITTSAALLVTGFIGILAGEGHAFTPTAIGIATAALLAWKEPLAGFSRALTDRELRSAILFAILAFVIYPVLPTGSVDPWSLIEPRAAWVTVILIAAIAFVNYVLLKMYGDRGIELASFLGGFINSTITVADLSEQTRETGGQLSESAYRGVMYATMAMLVRNAVILGLLAPAALFASAIPLVLMLIGTIAALLVQYPTGGATESPQTPSRSDVPEMKSPFSLLVTLKYAALFLAIQIAGTLAQRALGQGGFYAVSAIGGVVSSASSVAAAANLAAAATLPATVAALGATIATMTSAVIDIPLLARVSNDSQLTRRVTWALGVVFLLGIVGIAVQLIVSAHIL